MSSTNRGAERRIDDEYMTPGWCVDRLLEAWSPIGRLLVEPCAGEGNITRRLPGTWVTFEIREVPAASAFHTRCDFLTINPASGRNVSVNAVVTNPPFSLAEEFIRHSRELYSNADLVFLLRLNFAGSAGRLRLWRDLGMPDVYVLPNRPSFTGGTTDSCEYAWMRFPPETRKEGKFLVLNETPRSER